MLNKSFEGLQDWKLFQRGPAGDAPIPLAFSYRAADVVRLEVRLIDQGTGLPLSGFDFHDQSFPLPAAPDGTSDGRTLAGVPAGGNYDLEDLWHEAPRLELELSPPATESPAAQGEADQESVSAA